MSVTDDLKNVFSGRGNGLMRIILINIIIFLIVNIADQAIKFAESGHSLIYWLALPGDFFLALSHSWTFFT